MTPLSFERDVGVAVGGGVGVGVVFGAVYELGDCVENDKSGLMSVNEVGELIRRLGRCRRGGRACSW